MSSHHLATSPVLCWACGHQGREPWIYFSLRSSFLTGCRVNSRSELSPLTPPPVRKPSFFELALLGQPFKEFSLEVPLARAPQAAVVNLSFKRCGCRVGLTVRVNALKTTLWSKRHGLFLQSSPILYTPLVKDRLEDIFLCYYHHCL